MWLLLILPFFLSRCMASECSETEKCFQEAKYIECEDVESRPKACDCTNLGDDPCYIKICITRKRRPIPRNQSRDNEYNYFTNGSISGPTIITKLNSLVVLDVFNDMNEDTSIHFHGMRQHNVPWIDGVGNVTQYPVQPYGRFRYIFRAYPQGTHWYHSHMRYQRDAGLWGALIVHDTAHDIQETLHMEFIDDPGRKTLAILDHMINKTKPSHQQSGTYCLPDGSDIPKQFDRLRFLVNGRKLAGDYSIFERTEKEYSRFYVAKGQSYRFRIVGMMEQNIVIFSIAKHKLNIIATDGYAVEPFETDFLVVHVSERYDFILTANRNVPVGTTFVINIRSLAVLCNDDTKIAGQGYLLLVYTEEEGDRPTNHPAPIAEHGRCRDRSRPCTVLNCPFKTMPTDFNEKGTYMNCYNVMALKLLYPTKTSEVESLNEPFYTKFFNFAVHFNDTTNQFMALVNGVKNKLADEPLVEGSPEQCVYPVSCNYPGEAQCLHTVKEEELNPNLNWAVEFVLSSYAIDYNELVVTHPIHMHGHTYYIAKIGYPEYYPSGKIKCPNMDIDIDVNKCDPGKWKNSRPPSDIDITSTSVRKDAVIIPAGGYVVIRFIAYNPGYWFMHCHIDGHLNNGMAVVLAEAPMCASRAPEALNKPVKDFCFTVSTFEEKENQKPCNKRKGYYWYG